MKTEVKRSRHVVAGGREAGKSDTSSLVAGIAPRG